MTGVDRVLDVPQGRFELDRHPSRPGQPVRAWDAADELLLGHLAESGDDLAPTLIVNDAFGALTVALAPTRPMAVIDSQNARIALEANLAANGLGAMPVVSSLELPDHVAARTVVIKVPRSGGQLEDQLHRIRPLLGAETRIVGAAMARHIHSSTLELFESILGPTVTTRATKRARLIHPTFVAELDVGVNPWPTVWKHSGLTIVDHGGVFSATRIDNGTRLLLEALDEVGSPTSVIDLGCGNGLVGMTLARSHPDAAFVFVDQSLRALASAEAGWAANFEGRPATFLATDRLVNVVDRGTSDLIVTNPPFHEDSVVGDATAWDFFVDSHAVLRSGGSLIAVGNRHLGYHAKLAKIFGQVEVVASTNKYVVLRATRS